MIPVLLALAAAALYLLPLIVPKPPPPDEVALPPLPGAPTPTPAGPPSFVEAVAAYDRLRAFVCPRQYPPDEAARISAALQSLRLALVDPPSRPEVTKEVS